MIVLLLLILYVLSVFLFHKFHKMVNNTDKIKLAQNLWFPYIFSISGSKVIPNGVPDAPGQPLMYIISHSLGFLTGDHHHGFLLVHAAQFENISFLTGFVFPYQNIDIA